MTDTNQPQIQTLRDQMRNQIRTRLGIHDEPLVNEFVAQNLRLRGLQLLLTNHGEFAGDATDQVKEDLKQAAKSLGVENRAYRIAFVGPSGAGKSALVNGLLGREIVPSAAVEIVTGVFIEIYTVATDSQEQVEIVLRSEQDVLNLVKNFADDYLEPNALPLPSKLTINFAENLRHCRPAMHLSEERKNAFDKLHTSLRRIVESFIRYEGKPNDILPPDQRAVFQLKGYCLQAPLNPSTQEFVKKLADENSDLNKPAPQPTARVIPQSMLRVAATTATTSVFLPPIDMVAKIIYRLKPNNNAQNSLCLPEAIGLCDLPGYTTEQPIHNAMFVQGVKEANIVIIVTEPNRMPDKNSLLYELVKKSIKAPENVFFAINKWDTFQNTQENSQKLKRKVDEAQDHFNIKPERIYYTVSSPRNQSHPTEAERDETPKLLTDMMAHISKHFVRSEVNSGKLCLDRIEATLRSKYAAKKVADHEKILNARALIEQMRDHLHTDLRQFRRAQLSNLPSLQASIVQRAEAICVAATQHVLDHKIAELWRQNYSEVRDGYLFDPDESVEAMPSQRQFISGVELAIWRFIPDQMPSLVEIICQSYRTALEKQALLKKIEASITALAPSLAGQPLQPTSLHYSHALTHPDAPTAEADMLDDAPATQLTCSQYITDGFEQQLAAANDRLVQLSQVAPLLKSLDEAHVLAPKHMIEPELQATLARLPRDKYLKPQAFVVFMDIVRQRFQSIVTRWSVDQLLAFYKYQMIILEVYLVERLNTLRNDLDLKLNDPKFVEEVLQQEHFPNDAAREQFQHRRKLLEQFLSRVEAN
ncbi:MAG: dynamin family protein [Anaerolineae bacterium]|nr:dynamin family protein [Anaerolineae bacterium]